MEEIYFNELSDEFRFSMPHDVVSWVKDINEVCYGRFRTCRMDPETLHELSTAIGLDERSIRNLIWSFFKPPFEGEDDSLIETYVDSSWLCNGAACQGLAFSYLNGTLALSFDVAPWNESFIDIKRNDDVARVRNFSNAKTFSIHESWVDSLKPVVLVETELDVNEKTIALRDDHGKAELDDFARRMVKSAYVEGVVNSLPFNPRCRRFIKDVLPGGLIEIVLPWTDKGLGLVVRTTGRNLMETKAIAEILKEEFSRGGR